MGLLYNLFLAKQAAEARAGPLRRAWLDAYQAFLEDRAAVDEEEAERLAARYREAKEEAARAGFRYWLAKANLPRSNLREVEEDS